MNWDAAVALLHGADWRGKKAGLARIRELMRLLGDPQKELRFVHIAGTNGKGSAAAMLAQILTAAGYRTGRYISPHLVRVNERFCVNGEEITDADFTALASRVRGAAEKMDEKPAIFELLTALSFLWFLQEKCEIVVLEVGLGGRFDATNVIDRPLVAMIMQIGLEHTEALGDTVGQIAYEKGGIVKSGGDVVLCAQLPEVEDVVRRICAERGAQLTVTAEGRTSAPEGFPLAQRFSYRERRMLQLSLLGAHQVRNAAAVLDAVDLLNDRHGLRISEEAIRTGLKTVRWSGRFEVLSGAPLLIVDGAHNPDGMRTLAESIRCHLAGRRLIFLMGVMADKNYREMLDILQSVCREAGGNVEAVRFFAVSPDEARGLSSGRLKEEIAARFSCPVEACDSVLDGLGRALSAAEDGMAVLAFGSLYQVGEILASYESKTQEAPTA